MAPALPDRHKVPPTPLGGTLADAVDDYLIARKPAPKTIAETRLALRQFEEVVGRKSLASITRSDARQFVQHLAKVQVGGGAGKYRASVIPAEHQKEIENFGFCDLSRP